MNLLEAHEAMRREKGALKPKGVDLREALAEVQAYLASKDQSFKPKNDARPKNGGK